MASKNKGFDSDLLDVQAVLDFRKLLLPSTETSFQIELYQIYLGWFFFFQKRQMQTKKKTRIKQQQQQKNPKKQDSPCFPMCCTSPLPRPLMSRRDRSSDRAGTD